MLATSDEVFVDTSAFYAILDADDAEHDNALHANAAAALLSANRRKLSLVDCSSFAIMRQRGTVRAFAFDRHFTEQGFQIAAV